MSRAFFSLLLTDPKIVAAQILENKIHIKKTIHKLIKERTDAGVNLFDGWWALSDVKDTLITTTRNSFYIDERTVGVLRDKLAGIKISGEPLLLVERSGNYYIKVNDHPKVFFAVFLAYLEIKDYDFLITTDYFKRNVKIVERIMQAYLKDGWAGASFLFISKKKKGQDIDDKEKLAIAEVLIKTTAHHLWNYYTNKKLFFAFQDVEIHLGSRAYARLIKQKRTLQKITAEQKKMLITHLALLTVMGDEGNNIFRKFATKYILQKYTKAPEVHKGIDNRIQKIHDEFELKFEQVLAALILRIDEEITQFTKYKTLNK